MAAPPTQAGATQNPSQSVSNLPPSLLGQPNASTIDSLEQLRQRFAQLTHSLAQFQNQIISTAAQAQARSHVNVLSTTSSEVGQGGDSTNESLSTLAASIPQWPVMLTQLSVLLTQLGSLSTTINSHADILQHTVALPSATFPTATQAPLATTLLRKKPLPEVEEWIKQAKKRKDTGSSKNTQPGIDQSKPINVYDHLWTLTLEFLEAQKDKFEHTELLEEDNSPGVKTLDVASTSTNTNSEDAHKPTLTLDQLVSFTIHGGTII